VSVPTSRLDVGDPAFQADPYPQLAELRESTAIAWHEPSGRWLLARFAEVHDALRDRRLGRIHAHRYTAEELGVTPPDPRWAAFWAHERWSLLSLEPPDHTRIRRLVSKAFTPRSVEELRPAVEAIAAEHVGRCVQRGRFDLVSDLAQPYSVEVICSMLGVDPADTAQLLDWSHAIVKMYELTATEAQRHAADRAAAEFMGYARELIAERRARPDDRLISRLVSVEDEGARLSDHEVACTVMVLLEAGHEATVNTMGNGVRALLVHPEQWRRVARADVAARTAVEEMIRWDAPLQLFERWVLDEGVEIAGQELPIGSKVAMLFGSANRDPRRFADPDRFDAGRGDTAHIGFGGGIHFCVGAPLARLELEVALDELRRRAPDLSLAEEPTYHPTFVIHGLTALLVIAG
jgi:cytochrome P450